MANNTQPNPCHKCGRTPDVLVSYQGGPLHYFNVVCLKCSKWSPRYAIRQDAIDEWNQNNPLVQKGRQ